MQQFQARVVRKIDTSLGESPLWNQAERRLYFVDIVKNKVHRFDPQTEESMEWSLPSYVGAIAQGGLHELYVAVKNQVILLNTETGSTRTILTLDLEKDIRFNECKCDSEGRFWMGTMRLEAEKAQGAFYRINPDGSAKKMLANLSVPNGFCWSRDNKYLYHIDSFDYAVKRFSYDGSVGTISDPQRIVVFEENGIVPDGMCLDQNGMLWIAMWGGSKVVCFDPAGGQPIAEVQVPAPHVTSCSFGDRDLSTLYITTARLGLTDRQLEEYPLSGSVFSSDVGVGGFEAFKCQL